MTINEYLEDFDYGENHPERLTRLIQAVKNFNEEFGRSYPTKVTAEAYIVWLNTRAKEGVKPEGRGNDESAWSGGFAENH